MIRNNYIRFQIKLYSPLYLITILRENNVPFSNLRNIDDYTYTFEVSPRYLKIIKKLFKDVKIVKRYGMMTWIISLFMKKTTIFALVIATLAFFDLSNRVYDVNVTGTSHKINEQIKFKLQELGVRSGMRKPSYNELIEYENTLKNFFKDNVEFLEVRLKGVDILVKYSLLREEIDVPKKRNSLYAEKDGFIANFIVSSGEIMVKENQYVRQGDLLVSDTIIGSDGKEYKIGAYGKVFAYTWTIIELSASMIDSSEEVDKYSELLFKAQTMMSSGFEDGEKILEENILKYDISSNNMNLTIHFTCLENIAIEL